MAANRAILLTPAGVAAIAVVRLSGPGMLGFLTGHFSSKPRELGAVHGILRDDSGNEIDDPLVVLASESRFADINLHGGAWTVRALLDLARRHGFEVVDRSQSPLPDDAVDAIDPIEQEILAFLPLPATELALRALLAQHQAWRALTVPSPGEVHRMRHDRALHWLLHPPRVAIVGAANVGKSTIANRLFAQERSITADMPGTTRDWVGETANLDGLAVQLVDTPGIRITDDPIERESIDRSRTQIEQADLVVLVLDASRPLTPDQSPLLSRYPHAIRVVNKTDAPPAWDARSIDGIQTIGTSGKGVEELMRRIRAHFGCDQLDPKLARCWTDRQRDWVSGLFIAGCPDR